MNSETRNAARRATDNPVVEKGARFGYAANGVIHIVIGWIALQLALGIGGGGGEASASGALQSLAGSALGLALLWVILVGFVLLAVWQAATAFLGGETKDRIKAAAKAIVYLVLSVMTFTTINGTSSGDGTQGATATLMAQPFGRVLVGAVGLGVVAVGGYHIVKGWTKKFLEDLRQHPGTWGERAGRAGYIARGIAFIIVGGLFVAAATTADSEAAQGLDAALMTLQEAPFGKVLLAVVALGFIAFGVYSFFRARYARV